MIRVRLRAEGAPVVGRAGIAVALTAAGRLELAAGAAAADVNTVSPPHDVGGMTAFLAATCVRECPHLILAAEAIDARPR